MRLGCAFDKARYLYFMQNVKGRPRKTSRISSKHQITIPVDTLRAAGLKIGERVTATCDGAGRVVLERERDVLSEFVGALTGVYHRDEINTLRAEWE